MKLQIKTIKNDISKEFLLWLGVFGMEIDSNYMTLHEIETYNETDEDIHEYMWFEQMAKLQVLKLAVQTGYSHNDFHRSNLLIDPNYEGMYHKVNGKALIIDFGFATKLSPANIKVMKELYSKNKFSEALKIFKGLARPDGIFINDHPNYWWLYNAESNDSKHIILKNNDAIYDDILESLKRKEDTATKDRTKIYDTKHKQNPSVYPLLPLSNAIKNKFYQGMIEIDTKISEPPMTNADSRNTKSRNTKPKSKNTKTKKNKDTTA